MGRLKLTDDFDNIILKISEGNPGAITVIFEIIQSRNNDIMKALQIILMIDNMELYGSHLYMLWNDCCNRDLEKTLQVIDAFQLNKITKKDIDERIKSVGYGKPFDDLLKEK